MRRDGALLATLSRGRAYGAMISQKLAARQMPQELFYLAMIASDFKPAARSPASAVGLWQFMATTARHYLIQLHGADEAGRQTVEIDAAVLARDVARVV
ncbi:MAG: transglycosylase SLT domain-containing protein [Gemmatimonadaceae bacterium]